MSHYVIYINVMNQYNNIIGYMTQYGMHQYITISLIRYNMKITCIYISVFHMYDTYDIIYKTKENKIKKENINRPINVIYYINVCYDYHSIDYISNSLIYSLTFIYIYIKLILLTSIMYRQQLQFGQAIPLYLITFWGGNWSGIDIRTILFCFVLVL